MLAWSHGCFRIYFPAALMCMLHFCIYFSAAGNRRYNMPYITHPSIPFQSVHSLRSNEYLFLLLKAATEQVKPPALKYLRDTADMTQ